MCTCRLSLGVLNVHFAKSMNDIAMPTQTPVIVTRSMRGNLEGKSPSLFACSQSSKAIELCKTWKFPKFRFRESFPPKELQGEACEEVERLVIVTVKKRCTTSVSTGFGRRTVTSAVTFTLFRLLFGGKGGKSEARPRNPKTSSAT